MKYRFLWGLPIVSNTLSNRLFVPLGPYVYKDSVHQKRIPVCSYVSPEGKLFVRPFSPSLLFRLSRPVLAQNAETWKSLMPFRGDKKGKSK